MAGFGGPALTGASGADRDISRVYYRYVLTIMLLMYIVNFVDRQIINILAEPIKRDLSLSDTQLGLLTGLSFALFYTTFGLPLARAADRGHRPRMMSAALVCWSGFTVACGLVTSYWQLLLMRVGVGVGEAGCTPAAFSLILDYAPAEKRSSAVAFYQLGIPLGSLIGLALGGILAAHHGWRVAFVIAGLPGLVLALVVMLTIREPRGTRPVAADVHPTFKETIAYLGRRPTFWLLSLGAAFKAFVTYGQGSIRRLVSLPCPR